MVLPHCGSVSDDTQTTRPSSRASGIDRYFKLSERGSSVGSEVRGGVVTFLTMA